MSHTAGTRPVDADGHIVEVGTTLRDYLEPPYGARAKFLTSELQMVPTDGFDRNLGNKHAKSAGNNPAEWLEALEWGDLEWAVLYPSLGLHLGMSRDPDFAVAFCRAYNDWLATEICAPGGGRLRGVGLLPPQEPVEAAAELERVRARHGFAAAMLPADGPYLLGHRTFDPIYEAAARTAMPVAVHAGLANLGPGLELFPKFIQAHTIAHPFGILRQLTSLMFEGVFERFPDVRFSFLENGGTWVPWFLDRMDEEYRLRGPEEAPALTKPPSEYVRAGGNVFFGLEADERLLGATLDAIGDDLFMYASDWPHWDNDYPESLEALRCRSDLSDTQRHAVLRGAAERYYAI